VKRSRTEILVTGNSSVVKSSEKFKASDNEVIALEYPVLVTLEEVKNILLVFQDLSKASCDQGYWR